MNRVHPVAAAGFGAAADVYERARPTYPDEAVAWIVERTGLGPGRTVVDLGAGTGKLSRLLVRTGARVIAVEPLAEMRRVLEAVVPGVESVDGTAEELPLPAGAADVITCAQAFHWFDLRRSLPELHRVLVPGGVLVLVWNRRDLDDPLQADLEALLRPLRDGLTAQQKGEWRPPLEASPLFGELEERLFKHEHLVSAEDVCGRVASTSFVAALDPAARDDLLARVRMLVDGREELFPFEYVTQVFVAPRATGS